MARPVVLPHEASGLLEIFDRRQWILDFWQRLADVDEDEVRPLLGESNSVASAHAARGAGDQNALTAHASELFCGTVDLVGTHNLLQNPASTGKVTPVTYFASSETR